MFVADLGIRWRRRIHGGSLVGRGLFVYGSHWSKHIAYSSVGRRPNRISIIGPAVAKYITRDIKCKILVSVFGREMQIHVLSMDAPLDMHGRIAFPSTGSFSENLSHGSHP